MAEEFDDPRYAIDKIDGVRRIVHTSIRMIWSNEDPLAINLLIQSADRVALDVMKHRGIEDMLWDGPFINQDKKDELRRVFRAASNFVKHADREPDSQLGIHDIQQQAEIALFFVVIRYRQLTNTLTAHMKLYLGYHAIRYPDHMSMQGLELGESTTVLKSDCNVSQFRTIWGQMAMSNPEFKSELLADQSDSNNSSW